MANNFQSYSRELNSENVDSFEIYNRIKNISALDLHLCEKYHAYQTLNDFNKIGQIIEHEKALEISMLMHPCFVRRLQKSSEILNEKDLLKIIFKTFVLM